MAINFKFLPTFLGAVALTAAIGTPAPRAPRPAPPVRSSAPVRSAPRASDPRTINAIALVAQREGAPANLGTR